MDILDPEEIPPPGHPDTRPAMAECIIQRDAGIDATEAGLRFAVVVLAADADGVTVAAFHAAIVAATGAAPVDINVKPFFPEQFIICCGS